MAAVLMGVSSVALASSPSQWGLAWQQTIPAGGPTSFGSALSAIVPGRQTVILNFPAYLQPDHVHWPEGTREQALNAIVHEAGRTTDYKIGILCHGAVLTLSATKVPAPVFTPPLMQTVKPVPVVAVMPNKVSLAQPEAVSPPPVSLKPTVQKSKEVLAAASASPLSVAPLAQRIDVNLPDCVSRTDVAPARNPHYCIPVRRSRLWVLQPGETLRKQMDGWAKKVGWTIVWDSDHDLTVPALTTVRGQFEQAVTWAFKQLLADGVLFRVTFYEGNDTVVVQNVSAS